MSKQAQKDAPSNETQSDSQSPSYTEQAKSFYQRQSDAWMPWIETQYLRWFTNDNKASYATKQNLDKSKVTGIEPVDQVQDSANSLVSGQLGQKGLLKPVGDAVSTEGIDRAERKG